MEADGRPQKKPTSPWVYVGCGCAVLVLLGLLAIGGMTWWGFRAGKEMQETMTDPVKREAKVRSVLHYDQLPAGYYPAFAMTAPLGVMEMAMLTDRDPGTGQTSGQEFKDRGFMYMNMAQMRDNKEKMARFMRGEAPRPEDSGWSQSTVKFDPKEVVRRGSVTVNGTEILYSAGRGDIDRHHGRERTHGLVTMVMPMCPHDPRLRFAMWYGPDPAPDKPVAEADYSGTTADPAAIQEFLGHFRLCGK